MTEAKYFDLTDVYSAGQWNSVYSTDNKFKEKVTYDLRGNITSLQRNGYKLGAWTENGYTAANYDMIDNLSYSYDQPSSGQMNQSNQLLRVTDASLWDKGFRFANTRTASSDVDYTYDANGNLTSDRHKHITEIKYNYLNLPMLIRFYDPSNLYFSGTIEFVYDASGAKLRKIVKSTPINSAPTTDVYDYVNGVEYKNSVLQRLAHTEGAITRQVYGPTGAVSYNHEYALRDHLGNVRVTFTDGISRGDGYWNWSSWPFEYINPNVDNPSYNDGVITQADIKTINNPYPFGMDMEGNWNGSFDVANNKYKYNEKEWNNDFGLGLYDYGARFYDPAISRWSGIDAKAEKYSSWSSYNYVKNNPVKFVDPDGRDIIFVIDGKQTTISSTKDITDAQLRASIEAMLQTALGSARWKEYSASTTEDVYLMTGDLGQDEKGQNIGGFTKYNMSKEEAIAHGNMAEHKYDPTASFANKRQVHAVIIDPVIFKGKKYAGKYAGAEATYHELTAHIKNKKLPGNVGLDHKIFGSSTAIINGKLTELMGGPAAAAKDAESMSITEINENSNMSDEEKKAALNALKTEGSAAFIQQLMEVINPPPPVKQSKSKSKNEDE